MLSLCKRANQNDGYFRACLFVISLWPFLSLWWGYYRDNLGINPFDTLISETGLWALHFLLLSLAITPLRRWLTSWSKLLSLSYGKRLSDWNFLIKSRRMLGLYAFFYAVLHFLTYGDLDQAWDWEFMLEDIVEKPFLWAGILACVLLVPLAITSHKSLQRKMGKWWRKLHRWVYLIGVLVIVHFLLSAKAGENAPVIYGLVLFILLGHRVVVTFVGRYKRNDDTGLEAHRR